MPTSNVYQPLHYTNFIVFFWLWLNVKYSRIDWKRNWIIGMSGTILHHSKSLRQRSLANRLVHNAQVLNRLVRWFGVYQISSMMETNFVKLFPAKQYTAQLYIPIPEVVYLTKLRDTLTSLANNQLAVAVRCHFFNRNSIPRAEFDAQGLLTNADAFMPANYDSTALLEDVYAVKNWIESASDLKSSRKSGLLISN